MSTTNLNKEEVSGLAAFLANRIVFYLHAFAYLSVNLLLIIIWAVTTGLTGIGYFWPLFVMFGWGFPFGLHFIAYLMYNDKIQYLANVRRQSAFSILFVFHAWLYLSINTFIMIINFTFTPDLPYFIWVVALWGIGFGFHAIGFLVWRPFITKEEEKLKTTFPNYSEKRIESIASSHVIQFWLLLIHLSYFIVVNLLFYLEEFLPFINLEGMNFINIIYGSIAWGIIVGIHALEYYFFVIRVEKGEPIWKSFYLHIIAYLALNIFLIIYQFTRSTFMIWIHYPLISWGVVLALHLYVTLNWEKFLSSAKELMQRQISEQLEDFELRKEAIKFLFIDFELIAHILIYISTIILLGIQFAIEGIDLILLIYPIFGWLIAISINASFLWIFYTQESSFLKATAAIHISVYIPTSILMVLINILFAPGILWSVIAIAGWGIGVGLHVLLAYLLTKKQ
jgi:hypothetical protein